MITLEQKVEDLGPEHQDRLLRLLTKSTLGRPAGANGTSQDVPMAAPDPAKRYEPFPLARIQEAYLVGRTSGLELGNVAIHSYIELDCRDLDIDRLSRAWQQLIARHDMLRAVVQPDGTQHVLAAVPEFQIEVLDLRSLTTVEREARLAAVRRRLSHEMRDVGRWPLFEVCAALVAPGRTVLLMSLDILHVDEGSAIILTSELDHFYEHPDEPLSPLQFTFRDYVMAEAAFRESELARRAERYWFERIPTLPPSPQLPLARLVREIEQPRFVRRNHHVAPDEWRRIEARAHGLGVAPSCLLLTAYADVLKFWSDTDRFTLNIPVYNRIPFHPDVERIVGVFTSVNLLEFNYTTPGVFDERVRAVQRQLWLDLEHRYISGIDVLRRLAAHTGRPGEALMPVVFTNVLDLSLPSKRSGLSKLSKPQDGVGQTPQVWLDFAVAMETDGRVLLRLDAVDELFPAGLLDDLFSALVRLVGGISTGDKLDWRSTAWLLLPPGQKEARQLANATDASVNARVTDIAARFVPERAQAAALLSAEGRVTYRELDELTDRLACELRRKGVGQDQRVAIMLPKGWRQIAAALGVWKAGAAYVPISPDQPAERIELFLGACGAVAAIVADSSAATTSVVSVGWQPDRWQVSEKPLTVPGDSERLAYVLYTSGTTGMPKGVMISWASVANRMDDVIERFSIGSSDRVLAITALHHDLSVFDIFGMLGSGGGVIVPDAAGAQDPRHWLALALQHGATIWNSVPAFMEMLLAQLDENPEAAVPPLRLVLLSGDRIPINLPERMSRYWPNAVLMSLGGPTETTVWDICHPLNRKETTRIPYGRPMRNARYHVLDERLLPRPDWCRGELVIGGTGLARGYLDDPTRTQERFVSHPELGERLYRSGDMGRYLPGAVLDILGRADHQVKIRGHRIECAEIEVHLARNPAVRRAAVVVREINGEQQLVAFVDLAGQTVLAPPVPDSVTERTGDMLAFRLSEPGLRKRESEVSVLALAPASALDRSTWVARRSYRRFLPRPVDFASFSSLLSHFAQHPMGGLPFSKRLYGSAGNLYPVQLYLAVAHERVERVAAGVYYYNPKFNDLELLAPGAIPGSEVFSENNRELGCAAAFTLSLVADMNAIEPVYAGNAERFAILEAGLITQLLEMTAPRFGIGLCQMGELKFDLVRELYRTDAGHRHIHSLAGGAIDQSWSTSETAMLTDAVNATSKVPEAGPARIREVERALREKLPLHMVPSRFEPVKIPLTANGKTDYAALAALELTPRARSRPVTQGHEDKVARLWREILGLAEVSADDNFFELGGNSIHIVRLRERMQAETGREIPITDLFSRPTVADMAALLGGDVLSTIALTQGEKRGSARKERRRDRRSSADEGQG